MLVFFWIAEHTVLVLFGIDSLGQEITKLSSKYAFYLDCDKIYAVMSADMDRWSVTKIMKTLRKCHNHRLPSAPDSKMKSDQRGTFTLNEWALGLTLGI